MNKYKSNIWGRDFELNIIYECYPGEEIGSYQMKAIESINKSCIFDSVLEDIKKYVIETASVPIDLPINNIFKYVIPKSIYVPQCKQNPKIALMCNYKFDPEHGIAVVFENGRYKEIGEQDIIL